MKVVVDTNVLVSAMGWPGNARDLLRMAANGTLTIIISEDILAEYIEVISRDKFAYLEKRAVKRFLQVMSRYVRVAKTTSTVKVIAEDSADDKVLACAKTVRADLIATGDTHLLRLGRWSGIRIVTPREAVDIINGEN
jgi:putative PIN family toxin of toxin-antitoxin system